ncbi:hypothetical protein A2768_01500 [Candidatus Roizmanbacteria bacterium RIFCSPHIGHO2_01_FULL_37_16]|nr:MAG: hypothetical protein A2768_01500 [Candidatus Roizmanbacteria bacterium RIFCSPHIGHO2_01_FULL_37_16]
MVNDGSNNFIKTAIVIAVLLISSSIFYYLVIFLPQQSKQQLEQKIQLEGLDTYKETTTQQQIQDCLDEVNNRFTDPELTEKLKGKPINNQEAKFIIDLWESKKDECYKKYGR